MKKILYIGNNLKNKKSNISNIQALGTLLEKEGFVMFYASSKNNKVLRLLDMIWSCIKFSKQIDFVFIDTYSTLNFYYALIISQLCRLLNLKYIPILHGGNLLNRLKQNPKFSERIFNFAYKNISPSMYLVQSFEKYRFTNIEYIPNTIEINKYKFKERNYKNIDLLWVRSFSKIYNPSLAIKILKELQDEGLQASLCMVGPDSDGTLQEVKQLAKKLKVDVLFTGKLTKTEWLTLSKSYNIFINTTNFDNMPVSVVEAMALGLPIVSTNVGGLPYLIVNKEEGLLVEKDNTAQFVQAIKQIIEKPELTRAMVFNARHKVEAYDWETIKHKWFQVLR